MHDGFYLIDKEKDWTSFDACARLRKILNVKKIGHTGTLDPFATGLLVVAVGKATRLIPYLEKATKTYKTTIILNQTSETLDPTSEVIDVGSTGSEPSRAQIETVFKEQFTGKTQQIPPKYSALKIDGKRAYALARKGEDVEMKPREVTIHNIKLQDYTWPHLTVQMTVSAGFYVRSFARDIAESLGIAGGGLCSELRRLKVGELSVTDADSLERVTTPIDPKHILTDLQHIEIPSGRVQDFTAGRAFPLPGLEGDKVLVLCGGRSFGIGEFRAGKLQPRVVL